MDHVTTSESWNEGRETAKFNRVKLIALLPHVSE